MFVDASAIVAILTGETEARALAEALATDLAPITSAIAIYEAALAIDRKKQGGIAAAQADIDDFLRLTKMHVIPIATRHAREALRATLLFGRGSGSPAKLNMGDCFAYAVASTAGCALLFKGNDFSHTDIASALNRA